MARQTTYTGNQPQGLEAAAQSPAPVEFDAASPQDNQTEVIVNDDGSVEINSGPPDRELSDDKFEENLAERLGSDALSAIATEVLEGVEADIASRAGFIDNYNKGLDLLGLKIEEASSSRTQKRNVSKVGHPLLLEAVIKFQALARGELLPAIGPCKVLTVGGSSEEEDQLASDLESDMNYFLTQVDKGYYPDFDRGLFALAFGGNLFKKVYRDPLKRYPVSRSIQIEDLIVSEDAADINDAHRVTHRFFLKKGVLKKMQYVGEYVDVPLNAGAPTIDSTKLKQGSVIGVQFTTSREQDQEHELYETYTDLDLGAHGFREKGCPKDVPLPYIVTIDRQSRNVLSLRRNWKKGDKQYTKRHRIVHYGLIPSFGFLCLGYLHLLGNQTRALRAIWRILIDAGMFATFPGGMKAKGVRTDTNEIAPGPGEFVDVDIGPFDKLGDAFMMMPYKEPSAIFMQLAEAIEGGSQRMGGVPDMPVDEGRTHIPVGTMMAMVEQSTQQMASTHKRIHAAMQEELSLLKELFAEDPEALTIMARNPARKAYTQAAFTNVDLVPATDPNIPSQMHRIQQATALISLTQNSPGMYDEQAINRRALKAIGINDWQALMHQTPQPPPPPPQVQAKMAELDLRKQEMQQEAQDTQRKAAHEAVQSINDQKRQDTELQQNVADLKLRLKVAEEKERTARMRIVAEEKSQHRELASNIVTETVKQAHETERARLEAQQSGREVVHHADAQHKTAHITGMYALANTAMKPKPAPAGGGAAKGKGRPKGSKNKPKG